MDVLAQAMGLVLQWQSILALIGGSIFGLIIGILPGLGPAAGMALMLPILAGVNPATALIAMGALFKCSHFGGAITAILLNTPGDASNVSTMLDGYPMCEKGKGGQALALAATGAMVGGTIGMVCLIFFAPFLANWALGFGPVEYFLTALLALTVISAMIEGAIIKGLISAGLGFMVASVGYDMVTGYIRFAFGLEALEDGVPLIPMAVGLFAVTQAIVLSETAESISRIGKLTGSVWEGVILYFRYPYTIVRSAIIGAIVGILPAVGPSSAGLVSWAEAKRESKHPLTFGTGEPEGLVASETATNCCMPGDLVCTIALGIPGSIGGAIFLGVMIIYGVIPGPLVFTDKGDVVYALFIALVLTSFLIFIVGMTVARYLAVVTLLRNEIIVPAILVVALIGSFALRNVMADVIVSLVAGIFGYVMIRSGFSPAPFVLACVLGDMVEKNYHRALIMSGGPHTIFFKSTISRVIVCLIILSLAVPYLKPAWQKFRHLVSSKAR